ncbi:MAG: hypothetical protein WBA74_13845, partial [Cyclobacteriaceae bacterium]
SVQHPNLPEDITVEEKGDQLVLKKKIKTKRIGKDHIMSPKVLFDGLQSLYAILLNPDSDGGTDLNLKGEGMDDYDDSALVATVWAGSYFDEYDYDSFDYRDSSYSSYDDEEGSIFDS